jgi:hydroxymethylbilane synthase
LWQAQAVATRIAATGGPPCRLAVITTSGDQFERAPLAEAGGKRLFVKEIEDALLRGTIDLAVHSSKDMPVSLPDGLAIGGVLPREDPLDAFVLPLGAPESRQPPDLATLDGLVTTLGRSPSIGTGSVRRVAQLSRLFAGARFSPIRGNLDTRLKKLDEGGHDGLVLAAAGLRRLGLASRISFALPPSACVPAPGQGIIAVEIRADDESVRQTVGAIDDPATAAALRAERALVGALGGGCQTPIGALAALQEGHLELLAAVVALDGSQVVHGSARGRAADAVRIGVELAATLLADGADDILAEVRRAGGPFERMRRRNCGP